jgi:hypothetical protein
MPEQRCSPSPTTSEIAMEEEVKQAQKAFKMKRQEKCEAREWEEHKAEEKHIAAAVKAEKACRKAERTIRKAEKRKVAETEVEETTSLMKKQRRKNVNIGDTAITAPKVLMPCER